MESRTSGAKPTFWKRIFILNPQSNLPMSFWLDALRASRLTPGLCLEQQQLLFQSEDAREGIAAYVEKRTANFTGR